MLFLSILSTVCLGIVILLGLIILPQMESKGQLRVNLILILTEILAIVTIWVLYGRI